MHVRRPARILAWLAALFLSAAPPAQATLAAIMPTDAREYHAIYGYEPTKSELASVHRLRTEFRDHIVHIKTSADLHAALTIDDPLMLVVGHNEAGHFRFVSGDAQSLSELSMSIFAAGKIPVFLTCEGQCYTDAPGTKQKITFRDGLLLAVAIEHHFQHTNKRNRPDPEPRFASPLFPLPAPLTPQRCAALFRTKPNRQDILKEIRRLIFRFERQTTIANAFRITAAAAGTAILISALDDD